MFFSNILKLKSLTASKPFQTSSCLNNHKITKTTSSAKRPIKLLTSGDIELNPGPEENLNNHTILSVCSTMLLNLRLRQLGLRPVDVDGECHCFSVDLKYVLCRFSNASEPHVTAAVNT